MNNLRKYISILCDELHHTKEVYKEFDLFNSIAEIIDKHRINTFDNEKEIRKQFEKMIYSVNLLSRDGSQCPFLMIKKPINGLTNLLKNWFLEELIESDNAKIGVELELDDIRNFDSQSTYTLLRLSNGDMKIFPNVWFYYLTLIDDSTRKILIAKLNGEK